MKFFNRNPLVIILSGKMMSGKSKTSKIIKEIYERKNKKVVSIAYADYLKMYAKNILNWDGSEENKPRIFLQDLGTILIKEKVKETMLIERIIDDVKVYSYFFDVIIIDDVKVYSYFFDVIIINDARFVLEIEEIRRNFSNVKVIHITKKEIQNTHITETSLDNYTNYDYEINNNGDIEDLYDKINVIVEEL